MNFHVAAVAAIVMITLWLAQIYLSVSQWWDAKYGEDIDNGYTVKSAQEGKNISLWSPPDAKGGAQGGNAQISKSIGGYCTACNGSQNTVDPKFKRCDPSCGGGAAQRGLLAGQMVPRGFQKVKKGSPAAVVSVEAPGDCRVLCEQNRAGKDAANACSAWEFQPALGGGGKGGVGSTCFLYVLSTYPPNISDTDNNDSTAVAWPSYGLRRAELVRQVAVSVFSIAPLVILAVAYHNYYYGASDLGALSVAVPVAVAIALFAFLGLVGFRDTYPDLPRGQCFDNQACFANAATGGLNSGVCYGKCCGATVSCRVEGARQQIGKQVYNTCTWPNVACKDGACSSDPSCVGHGGLAADYCESGGAQVWDGADYNGNKETTPAGSKAANPCYAVNTLQNSEYLAGGSSGAILGGQCLGAQESCPLPYSPQQYQGESNTAVRKDGPIPGDTGLTVLPAGLSDPRAKLKSASTAPILPFEMTANLETFLAQEPTDPKKPVWGCGLATDKTKNRDVLFLKSSTPNYMTCNVSAQAK